MILTFIFWCTLSRAQSQNFYDFQINNDRFRLEKTNQNWVLDGQDVRPTTMEYLKKLMDLELVNPCPSIRSKPDIIVTNQDNRAREFFRLEKTIREGEKCLRVSIGMEAWPYHKDWFSGPTRGSIKLGDTVTLRMGSNRYQFVRQSDVWENTSATLYPDMAFVRETLSKIEDFKIDFLFHPSIKGGKVVHLETGGMKLRLERLNNGLWVLLHGPSRWPPASEDWRSFKDFQNLSLISEKKLVALFESKGESADRLKRFSQLTTPEIESARKQIRTRLQDMEESLSVRKVLVDLLIRNPMRANVAILVDSLNLTQKQDLRIYISEKLHLLNKEGPLFTTEDTDSTVSSKVDSWNNWFKKQYP